MPPKVGYWIWGGGIFHAHVVHTHFDNYGHRLALHHGKDNTAAAAGKLGAGAGHISGSAGGQPW